MSVIIQGCQERNLYFRSNTKVIEWLEKQKSDGYNCQESAKTALRRRLEGRFAGSF